MSLTTRAGIIADTDCVGLWEVDTLTGFVNNDPVGAFPDASGWVAPVGTTKQMQQGTGTKKPLYKTNQRNGLPALSFDGVDDFLETTPRQGATQTIILVRKLSSAGLGSNKVQMQHSGPASSSGLGMYQSGATTPGKHSAYLRAVAGIVSGTNTTTNWEIVVLACGNSPGSAGNTLMYVDGTQIISDTQDMVTISSDLGAFFIGKDDTGALMSGAMLVGAAAAFKRKLSPGDVADITNYFKGLWGDIPGTPTSLAADPTTTSLEFSWSAPTGGGAITSYQVRIDGGSPVTATSPHLFDTLTPGTSYTLEVRAVGPGGNGAWASLVADTDDFPPLTGGYRVTLEVGPAAENVFTADQGDAADYGVILPLTCGYDIADSERVLPVQAGPTILAFSVLVPDSTSALIDAIAEGAPVSFRMYVDDTGLAWQAFDGVITQVTGAHVRNRRGGADEWDWRVDVYASNVAGLDKWVGWLGYGEEELSDRLTAIGDDSVNTVDWDDPSLPFDPEGDPDLGLTGAWLPATAAGDAVSALDHLRKILRYAAASVVATVPPQGYARWVFGHDPHELAIRLRLAYRKIADAGDQIELDGGLVEVAAKWAKIRPYVVPLWAIVDTVTYGTPVTDKPDIVTTPWTDPSPGDSDTARQNYAGFVVFPADDFTVLSGWRIKPLKYRAHLDPSPVAGLLEGDGEPVAAMKTVTVTDLGAELEVDGADTFTGLLTGVQLVIPPGGDYFLTLKLRPELPPVDV